MAEKMKKHGETAEVSALIKKLGDPNANARMMAAEALGKIGDPRAIGPLIKALQEQAHPSSPLSEEPGVIRAMAADALIKIAPTMDNKQRKDVIDNMAAGARTDEDLKAVERFADATKDPEIAKYAVDKMMEAKREKKRGGERKMYSTPGMSD